MQFWTEAREIASGTLRTWRFLPQHLLSMRKLAKKVGGLVGELLLSVLATILCGIAPLFFWLAPVFVPLRRRSRAKDAQAKAEALESWNRGRQRLTRRIEEKDAHQ